MGIMPTAPKKTDVQPMPQTTGDEKKMLVSLNNRIEELKVQNLENAKFLRGISRKIENELSQLRDVEEGKSVEAFDDTSIIEGIQRIENSINKMNDTLLGFNVDVIFLEIDKVNRSLKQLKSDNLIRENGNMSTLNEEAIMGELRRLETLISEINSNYSKTVQSDDMKNMLLQNAQKAENMQAKLERISSMPVTVKSVIQSENEANLKRIDEHLIDLNQQQDSKMQGLKSLIGFNLWLSLLAVVLIIVNILGII